MVWEKCSRKQRIDGQLGGAAHVGGQKDGHFPIPVRGQRSGCHNRRHRAAKANEHWHKASAGQSDFPQQLVHHKCHPRHIAAVLQNGQEEKQHHNNGQKAQHAAYSRKYAVNHQGMHHRIDAIGTEPLIADACKPVDTQLQAVRKPCADYPKG